MKDKIGVILIILVIWNIYSFIRINDNEVAIKKSRNLYSNWLDQKLETVDEEITIHIEKCEKDFKSDIQKALKTYKADLRKIKTQLKEEEEDLKNMIARRKRAESNLPAIVELEDAYRNLKKTYGTTFNTSVGAISVNHKFYTIPSTGEIAYMRLGKQSSSDRSALIKAFLNEAKTSKKDDGYRYINSEKKTTDYGKFVKNIYSKGDSYFHTYYEYTRVQGTYNSTSYIYDYFIEVGSKKRKERYKKEQYSRAIGN